ncbi:MAG: hypothetical protein JNJ44_05245 [Zoogloeaceae bacterium]|nr:hypothetical protein [Zoogloeaceae bacterium]
MLTPTYLFLDFDGVTHPWGGVEDFRCLPLVETVLREFSETRVVITSDWRMLFSIQKLVARFSEDIRCRVVGATPHLLVKRGVDLRGLREKEARLWLSQHGATNAPWLAIDDAPGNWITRSRLILTDFKRGFTEEDAEAARRLLTRLGNGSFREHDPPQAEGGWPHAVQRGAR